MSGSPPVNWQIIAREHQQAAEQWQAIVQSHMDLREEERKKHQHALAERNRQIEVLKRLLEGTPTQNTPQTR